jgi:deoxycytidine triphosphate deaminase
MIQSDKDIHLLLKKGELVILGTDPAHPFIAVDQVQPCSIDLRLGNRFLRFKPGIEQFDIKDISTVSTLMEEEIVAYQERISLAPNGILFGQIYEQLRLPPKCCGYIEGRSRFARLGLSVHVTGGFINPEFEGAMPLQIVNNNSFPIVIYPYITICQLLLYELSTVPLIPYPRRSNNPYHRESKASPSIIGQDYAIASGGQFLPNLNREIECRLLNNYLNELSLNDEKQRMIDAINESSPRQTKETTIINQNTNKVIMESKVNVSISNVEGDISGVAAAGADQNMIGVAFGTISGTVTSMINQLPDKVDSEKPSLKELLSQLQIAIETDSELSQEDKAEALEQLQAILKLGQKPNDGTLQKAAKTAMKILKGTVLSLSDANKLYQAGTNLLPVISSILGLSS